MSAILTLTIRSTREGDVATRKKKKRVAKKKARRQPAGNSAVTAKKRVPGRPFKPGQSGNPSGRPPVPVEVREAARAHTAAAIATLVASLQADSESVRVMAANSLLDRAWGKPTQALEHSGPDGGPVAVTWTDLARKASEK